jgi:hypothetical protein
MKLQMLKELVAVQEAVAEALDTHSKEYIDYANEAGDGSTEQFALSVVSVYAATKQDEIEAKLRKIWPLIEDLGVGIVKSLDEAEAIWRDILRDWESYF